MKVSADLGQVALVSDTAEVTRQVSLLGLQGRKLIISKHISIPYNILHWTMCIFAV